MTENQRETREKILDTAEELFAREGFGAVSLRRIIGDAGVNLASVHYYFGSKEGLVEAIVGRLVVPVHEERARRLAEMREEFGEDGGGIENVVRAFIEPVFYFRSGSGRDGKFVAKLMGRLMTEYGEEMWQRMSKIFQPTVQMFVEAMKRLWPEVGLDRIFLGMHFMVGTMAHTVGSVDFLSEGRCMQLGRPLTQEQIIDDLVIYISGGIKALTGENR